MNQNVHTAEVLPPRAMLMIGIVGFHVILVYALTHGLMGVTLKYLDPKMEVVPIRDVVPVPTPPVEQRIEPTLQPTPRIFVPEPVIPIDEPAEPVQVAAIVEQELIGTPIEIAPPPQPLPLKLVGRNVFPDADSYYPPEARRRNEEGTALVRACVDERARLDGTPMIETSTGNALLDAAAVRVAKDGRYARAMRGEVAVPNCHRFRVTFSLR